ncbi:hypothetical protein V8B97DRAFT_1924826 [Scleroderma yunnanense]
MSSALATTTQNATRPHEFPPKVPPKQGNSQSKVEEELSQELDRPPPLPVKQPPSQDQDYTKKVPHRSGKPIINWFQRKLAGTVRTRRVRDESSLLLNGQHQAATNGKSRHSVSAAARPGGRSVSSPFPHGGPASSQKQGTGTGRRALAPSVSHRRTISLNDTDTDNLFIPSGDEDNVEDFTRCSSLARDSMWSPGSVLEADEDASLRPFPPSAPPSPSPSHSSSSYLSNPRTFRSIAASTKPTTVLSIDLPPASIGHIAQVPPTPTQLAPRYGSHARTSSTGTAGGANGNTSITFAAFSPPLLQSLPGSHPNRSSSSSSTTGLQGNTLNGLQAPLHTAHHPRNNPRPWSPPPDNASVLTLASSAFAIPGARMTMGSMGSTVLSGVFSGGDSISQIGGSATGDAEGESQFVLGDDDRLDVDGERDADASLRALRPRSSRRGSWESEISGWSARILGAGAGVSSGSKSLWTSNSLKTGETLGLEDDGDEKAEEIEGPSNGTTHENLEQSHPKHVDMHGGTEQENEAKGSVLQRNFIESGEAPTEDMSVTLGQSTGQTIVTTSLAVLPSPLQPADM